MSAIIKEIYDAFRSAGVSDEQATAAAKSIPIADALATKADVAKLSAEVADLRAEMHSEVAALRADMKDLELRMTVKLYSALGVVVAAIKALDILIG